MSDEPTRKRTALASAVDFARGLVGKRPDRAELGRREREALARVRAQAEGWVAVADADLAARHRESGDDAVASVETRVALAAEVLRRAHGLEARDNQLAATLAMVRGCAVELPTGEGKTVVGVLAAAALAGRGVHVFTPNEYLATRDAAFAAPVLARLGLRAEAVVEASDAASRRQAYRADVTYGAARTFAFDRLRDSVKRASFDRLEPRAHAALVDELDSLLVDFGTLPFVLGDGEREHDPWPARMLPLVERMRLGIDYEVDRQTHQVWATTRGEDAVLETLVERGVLAPRDLDGESEAYELASRALRNALEARELFENGRDYLVQDDGTIVPLERSTGRLGVGRRFAQGLHAALEAKERVEIRGSGRFVAEIDVRSLLASYRHLAGMSGTLRGLDEELWNDWQLELVRLPPHVPSIRRDDARAFATREDALRALLDELRLEHGRRRPVLVGVQSEQDAGQVSRKLSELGLAHRTLTARDHAREAEIVAAAGTEGAITVATQVAGRGTDIRLGAGVDELGGLRILALGHARDRRIDDQLRGRAGRGGDPGHVTFFASLEDLPVVENAREDELGEATTRRRGETDAALTERAMDLVERAQRRGESRARAQREEMRRFLLVLAEQRVIVESLQKAIVDGTPHESDVPAEADELERIRPISSIEADVAEFVARRGTLGRAIANAPALGPEGVAAAAAVLDVYRAYGYRTTADALPSTRAEAIAWLVPRVVASVRARLGRLLSDAEALATTPLDAAPKTLSPEDWERASRDFEVNFGRRPDGKPSTIEQARAELARQARAIALGAIAASPFDALLRAYRVASLGHLAAAFQEHVEETRMLAPTASMNMRGRGDPGVTFRVETHRRFEERLGRARTAAASQVLRALARAQSPT